MAIYNSTSPFLLYATEKKLSQKREGIHRRMLPRRCAPQPHPSPPSGSRPVTNGTNSPILSAQGVFLLQATTASGTATRKIISKFSLFNFHLSIFTFQFSIFTFHPPPLHRSLSCRFPMCFPHFSLSETEKEWKTIE
jgi:hypothetical protein